MPASDFQTHPVFKRGVSPKVRFLIYAAACMLMLAADVNLHYLEPLRDSLFTLVSPMRKAASEPAKLLGNATEHFSNLSSLQTENSDLRQRQLDSADRLLRFDGLEQENAQLRELLGMRKRIPVVSVAAEVLYNMPDSSSRKIIIDQGKRSGITPGLAVVDADGLIGQVTRVYADQSEVTLITDRNQAVPVQMLRRTEPELRGVMFGIGRGLRELGDVPKRWRQAVQSDTEPGSLELRFVQANQDIKEGDRLVTSGLDGIFLPGLPVGEVLSIQREGGPFARIVCRPLGGVEKSLRVLVLGRAELPPPLPKPETGDPPPPPVPPRARAAAEEED